MKKCIQNLLEFSQDKQSLKSSSTLTTNPFFFNCSMVSSIWQCRMHHHFLNESIFRILSILQPYKINYFFYLSNHLMNQLSPPRLTKSLYLWMTRDINCSASGHTLCWPLLNYSKLTNCITAKSNVMPQINSFKMMKDVVFSLPQLQSISSQQSNTTAIYFILFHFTFL